MASLGMGIYNSVQSSQKMDEYRSALATRMAQNAAKQAQAESPTLSPVGQSYLTASEGALKQESILGLAQVIWHLLLHHRLKLVEIQIHWLVVAFLGG